MKRLHKLLPWALVLALIVLSDSNWQHTAAVIALCLAFYGLALMVVTDTSEERNVAYEHQKQDRPKTVYKR